MTTSDPRLYRRDVLRLAAGVVAGAFLPGVLSAGDPPTSTTGSIDLRRAVLLIELRGGNDGLNTVVPFADGNYRSARPTLAIPGEQVLKIDAKTGLHPALAPLGDAIKGGDLAIVQGVGYPQPNRSHFRGIDIWHGATKADELGSDGWLARILAHAPLRKDADLLADGVVLGAHATIGYQGLGPLYGPDLRVLVMDSPADFIKRAAGIQAVAGAQAEAGSALAQVLGVQADIAATAQRLAALDAQAPQSAVEFPNHELGRQLAMAARLITAEAGVPVWKLTLEGFDTPRGIARPARDGPGRVPRGDDRRKKLGSRRGDDLQ
jgi:uncharacterized protein (DUF1501 family)